MSTTYLVTTEIVLKDCAVFPKVISFHPEDETVKGGLREALESIAHFYTINQYEAPFTRNAKVGDVFTHQITIATNTPE